MPTRLKKDKNRALSFQYIFLQNWRNFSNAKISIQNRTFLFGPNASGKSNFLDAFRFLHDLASIGGGGLQEAVRKRGGVSRLRALSARRYSDIIVKVKVGSSLSPNIWRYEIHFNQDNRQRPVIKKEYITKDGKEILNRPNQADRKDSELLTQTHLEQVNANREFRDLADFFSTVRYLHLVPQLVREPDRSVGRKKDPYGGDFLEQIAGKPDKTRDNWLIRISEALKVAVPQIEEIKMERDTRGTPHLKAKYEHWRAQGAWQSEDQFSDGTLRLMGLLWSILEGSGPLLLEEPELSLHPEVVKHLPQMLARVQNRTGRQIILSTHSADLLRDEGIGLDEVILFTPEKEGTTLVAVKKISEAKELLKGGLTIADIVIPRTRPQGVETLPLFEEHK
ncbi:MAG: ATP-binding protein [Thermodesulfobacteriota bacterium]